MDIFELFESLGIKDNEFLKKYMDGLPEDDPIEPVTPPIKKPSPRDSDICKQESCISYPKRAVVCKDGCEGFIASYTDENLNVLKEVKEIPKDSESGLTPCTLTENELKDDYIPYSHTEPDYTSNDNIISGGLFPCLSDSHINFLPKEPDYGEVTVGMSKDKERVVHPNHYTHGELECWDVAKHFPYLEGNCIKYLWRHQYKNGAEDIKKTIMYCQKILKETYGVTAETIFSK